MFHTSYIVFINIVSTAQLIKLHQNVYIMNLLSLSLSFSLSLSPSLLSFGAMVFIRRMDAIFRIATLILGDEKLLA